VASELGRRFAGRGVLGAPDEVVHLSLDELDAIVGGAPCPPLVPTVPGPPLPTAFRLAGQHPVAVATGAPREGMPASAGRGCGTVAHDPARLPDHGGVLVVDVLDPRLAAVLGRLSGLVSETGSSLSHLAILAREQGVPTVVAVPDARRRYPPGTLLLVDGDTGELTVLETTE
jgi:pyruvate,water dikinase